MRYRANPVLVEAKIITAVGDRQPNGNIAVILQDGLVFESFECDPSMTARYVPKPGDYFVKQSDGYIYLNPREVFERKYSPIGDDAGTEPNALELGAAVRRAGLAGS